MYSTFKDVFILGIVGILLFGCKTGFRSEGYTSTATTVILRAESKGDQSTGASNITAIANIVRERLNELHVREADTSIVNSRKVSIQLPSWDNLENLVRIISTPGILELSQLVHDDTGEAISDDEQLITMRNWDANTRKLSFKKIVVKRKPIISGDLLRNVAIHSMSDEYYVTFDLSIRRSKLFEQFTSENIGKRLAIIVDGVAFSAPVIYIRIMDGKLAIMSGLNYDEARNLAIVLKTGPLPAPVVVVWPN